MSRYHGRLPMTYEEAQKCLQGRKVRTVVNNTRVALNEDLSIAVLYHGNTIATFYGDGSKVFTTCGYASTSTNDRLNAMVPPYVRFRVQDGGGVVEIRQPSGTERASTYHYELIHTRDGYTTRPIRKER